MAWYLKASNLGNLDAMDRIECMDYKGLGTKVNYKKTMKWYLKSLCRKMRL